MHQNQKSLRSGIPNHDPEPLPEGSGLLRAFGCNKIMHVTRLKALLKDCPGVIQKGIAAGLIQQIGNGKIRRNF
jgi:hypothetical protein